MTPNPIDVTITINSKTNCPFCEDAKAFLSSHGIPFVETKIDDDDARNALYDRLGLAGDQRRVPQVMLTYAGEHMRIGGARELRMSGVQSLFGPATIAARVPASSAVVSETAGMVVADEGHACCE
jgi:glutaredoxin 3